VAASVDRGRAHPAGAVVVAYPIGATYYNNYLQTTAAKQYTNEVRSAEPQTLQDQLAAAARYNAALTPGVLKDPWTEDGGTFSADYQAYLKELALFSSMARLRIPGIRVDLPVYHGTSDDTLARGIGHLFGTALPIGGAGTHSVLTGHSSLATATMFDHLHELKIGDTFYIDVYGETHGYQVDKISTVLPDQFDELGTLAGEDHVTLVTCTPYAVNSHRLLVRGIRMPDAQVAASAPSPTATPLVTWRIESWMVPRLIIAGIALALLALLLTSWLVGDLRRRARRKRHGIAT